MAKAPTQKAAAPAPAVQPDSQAGFNQAQLEQIAALLRAPNMVPASAFVPGTPDPAMVAAAEAQARAEAEAHAAAVAPIEVEALQLIAYDGNPETPGAEWYAPEDFDAAAHCKANGLDELVDGEGEPITIAGHRFWVSGTELPALVKARAVRPVAIK